LHERPIEFHRNVAAWNSAEGTVTRDFDLAVPPTDPNAVLGYADIYTLWKADQAAFDQGHHISDAEYLIWMARVRMHLVPEEKAIFDEASRGNSIDEFRAEKSAAVVSILRGRHGLPVTVRKGKLRPAS
jgi:hypothetical protein